MGFLTAIKTGFRKYFTLSGRASRAEYWWWTLFVGLGSFVYSATVAVLLAPVSSLAIEDMAQPDLLRRIVIALLFILATLVPSITITVRRLHDVGRTGAWLLLPWILYGAIFWGALMAIPDELRALGISGINGDPLIGGLLMLGASLGLLALSIMMLIWMLMPGTRGDNYFGPDPRGGTGASEGRYARSFVPGVAREATPSQAQLSRKEEISALYRQRVLGQQN